MLEAMASDELRVGDGDRQVAADRLRSALDEGRLDLHEYDERLQQAYAAKTYGELNGLLADLPTTVSAQRAQLAPAPAQGVVAGTVQSAAHPDATRRWLVEQWSSYVGVVGIVVMIWFLSGTEGGFWPIWVAGPWGAILLWRTVTGLASGEPQRWAAKRDRKRKRASLEDPPTA